MESLEPKLMLTGVDWHQLPVYAAPISLLQTPAIPSGVSSTAAFQLIGAPQEHSQFGFTGAGYSVAILDTGIDYNNQAFAGRYLGGWNFVAGNADPLDDNGHGTHIAGVIASASAEYPGVAPGVGIIALKVLGADGVGTYGNVDAALQWVATNQQKYHIVAVNMSFGSGVYTANPFTFLDSDFERLQDAGVFIAAASGNGYYGNNGSNAGLSFPAADPLVVSVGATWAADYGKASWATGAVDYSTGADKIASFTQRDVDLDLLAPGAFVTSTFLENSFVAMAGTSVSTAMATGAAVIVRQALDVAQHTTDQASILHVLQSTGVQIVDSASGTNGDDNVAHTGLAFQRIDLLAAVSSVSVSIASPTERYVATLYETILGREPEQSGLDYWSGLLDSGLSRSVVLDAIWYSTEHLGIEVKADYMQILNRLPGIDEIAYWVRLLENGLTNDAVQLAFYASDEYFNLKAN